MQWIPTPDGDRLAVDAETAALLLGCSKTELEVGAREKRYGHIRYKQRTAFTAEHLAAIIAQHQVEAVQESASFKYDPALPGNELSQRRAHARRLREAS